MEGFVVVIGGAGEIRHDVGRFRVVSADPGYKRFEVRGGVGICIEVAFDPVDSARACRKRDRSNYFAGPLGDGCGRTGHRKVSKLPRPLFGRV